MFRNLMSIIIVLTGMSVLTTMARAVSERDAEIGTLRSIGFRGGRSPCSLEAALSQ
jgi:ABC-type lipoprotein release transport system permease subunit